MCKTHFGRGVISAAASDVTTISDESGIRNPTVGLREWVYLKHDKKIKKSFVQFVSNQFNMTFPKPSFQLLGVYLIHHYLVAIYRIMQMTIIIKEKNSCRAKSYWDPLNGRWWSLSLWLLHVSYPHFDQNIRVYTWYYYFSFCMVLKGVKE